MGLITLLAASEGGSQSYTLFYVVGGILAVFGVLVSVVGFMKPDFPSSDVESRAVMGLGAILAVAAGAAAVYVTS